ncbi:MAG: glycosyltransferase family 2 protein, partial [Candidatus Rokuibacteriota bacterium]
MGTHNAAPWLGAAVASVLGQTLDDLELIVIDDGSIDETPAVLAALRDPRLRVERQPRAGLTRALARALGL